MGTIPRVFFGIGRKIGRSVETGHNLYTCIIYDIALFISGDTHVKLEAKNKNVQKWYILRVTASFLFLLLLFKAKKNSRTLHLCFLTTGLGKLTTIIRVCNTIWF